jgi:hypothetical protein
MLIKRSSHTSGRTRSLAWSLVLSCVSHGCGSDAPKPAAAHTCAQAAPGGMPIESVEAEMKEEIQSLEQLGAGLGVDTTPEVPLPARPQLNELVAHLFTLEERLHDRLPKDWSSALFRAHVSAPMTRATIVQGIIDLALAMSKASSARTPDTSEQARRVHTRAMLLLDSCP